VFSTTKAKKQINILKTIHSKELYLSYHKYLPDVVVSVRKKRGLNVGYTLRVWLLGCRDRITLAFIEKLISIMVSNNNRFVFIITIVCVMEVIPETRRVN
jgi:hypothetical protein